MTHASNLKLQL